MTSDTFDLRITGLRVGTDWRIELPLADPLTLQQDDVFRIHVREKISSPDTVLRFSSVPTSGQGLITIESSCMVMSVEDALTATLKPGLYLFDIEINRGGVVDIPVAGTMDVLAKITRG